MMRIVIALIAAALLAGCQAGSSQDTEQVKGTVMEYSRLLAEGYASLKMGGLAKVSDREQVTKVYYHMASLGEARTKLVSHLNEISFGELKFPNRSTATVETKELWAFRHVNIDTGKVTLEEKNYPYDLDYRLRKRNGVWLVHAVTSIDNPAGRKDVVR